MPILAKEPAFPKEAVPAAEERAQKRRRIPVEPPLPGIGAWLGALKAVSVLAGAGFIAKLAHEQMLGIQLTDWSVLDLSLFAGRWVVDSLTAILSTLAQSHYLDLFWILLALAPALVMMFATGYPRLLRGTRWVGIGLAAIALSFVIVHDEVPTFSLNKWLTDDLSNLSSVTSQGRLGTREGLIHYVYFVSKSEVESVDFAAMQTVAQAYLQKQARMADLARAHLALLGAAGTQSQAATPKQQAAASQQFQTATADLQSATEKFDTARTQLQSDEGLADALSTETAELFPNLVLSRPMAAMDASAQLNSWYSRDFLICAIVLFTCFVFVLKGGHDLEDEILAGCYYFTAFILLPVACALLPYMYGKLICASDFPKATLSASGAAAAQDQAGSDSTPHDGVLISDSDQDYTLLSVQSGNTQTHIFSASMVPQIKIEPELDEDIVNYVLTKKAEFLLPPAENAPASPSAVPKESQP